MSDTTGFPHEVEAAAPCLAGGVHTDGIEIPPDVQGRPFNIDLLRNLMGAALADPVGCLPCQAAGLDEVAADADTFTRLTAITAMAMAGTFGGVPPQYLDPADGATHPLLARVWAAGADQPEGKADEPMYVIAAAAAPAERRAAAGVALDMLVGFLMLGGSE